MPTPTAQWNCSLDDSDQAVAHECAMKATGNLNRPLQVGDRCRLSDLGRKRNPRRGVGLCEVVSFGNSSQRIRVRFLGYLSVHTMHASYLEPVLDDNP